MNKELSIKWGSLLVAQGEGKQLQRRKYMSDLTDWLDAELDEEDMVKEQPDWWRVKPKTRIMTVWVFRDKGDKAYRAATSDQGTHLMMEGVENKIEFQIEVKDEGDSR